MRITADHTAVATEEGRVAISRPGHGRRRSLNVWLVDDDESFSGLLAELLNHEGDVNCSHHFPSAEAVLEALNRQSAPDVILLDIDMGGMSGLDAIRPIKQRAASTHVLMLTTFYDSQRRSRALREGATDFLLKMDVVDKVSRRIHQIGESARGGTTLAGYTSAPYAKGATQTGEHREAAGNDARPGVWRNTAAHWARFAEDFQRGLRRRVAAIFSPSRRNHSSFEIQSSTSKLNLEC